MESVRCACPDSVKWGFVSVSGAPATTSAATSGFSLGFSKPAASATPFALPVTTTSASGLTLSSALTSTPAGEAEWETFAFMVKFTFYLIREQTYLLLLITTWFWTLIVKALQMFKLIFILFEVQGHPR